jgi:hypothetical protein
MKKFVSIMITGAIFYFAFAGIVCIAEGLIHLIG